MTFRKRGGGGNFMKDLKSFLKLAYVGYYGYYDPHEQEER
jgi:hypothetical protein